MGHPQVADRFAGHLAAVEQLDAGAHLLEHIEHASAAGIEAHVLHGQVGAGGNGAGHQPEGG